MSVLQHRTGPLEEHPLLCDYLLTVESEQLTIGLCLKLGAVEVGLIGVAAGKVIHAELPGIEGDAALELLAQLGDVHVELCQAGTVARTVEGSWKSIFADALRAQGPGRAGRRAAVCEQLRAAGFIGQPQDEERGPEVLGDSEVDPELRTRAEQQLLELLHRDAMIAYLRGDFERALAAMRLGSALAGAPAYRTNLERLRQRILEEQGRAS